MKTVIDTSFTVSEDFDVHHWMEEQDMNDSEPIKSREINKEIKITIPRICRKRNRVSARYNDYKWRHHFPWHQRTELKMMFHDFPELEDLNIQEYMDQSMKGVGLLNSRALRTAHTSGLKAILLFPPLHQYMIPGLECLKDLGALDNIVIKKKRHGKKIIISFEDRENDAPEQHGNNYHYYYNDDNHAQWTPKDEEKKVIIKKRDLKDVDENFRS